MNKQLHPPISLDTLLEKASKLNRLLESTWNGKLSQETKENLRWYCDWRLHQYYKQYKLYLQNQKPKGETLDK